MRPAPISSLMRSIFSFGLPTRKCAFATSPPAFFILSTCQSRTPWSRRVIVTMWQRCQEQCVQQPCRNPSKSPELLEKLIARKMPICGKRIPCGDFLAWEHLVAPRDGLCFLLSLALRGNLPLFFRRRPGILQRCGLLRRRSRPVQDLLETSEHHLVEVLGCQDVDVVAKGFLLR
jgi:hypothetical protein